jgi:hypothetical protein
MHFAPDEICLDKETIKLDLLDNVAKDLGIDRIDFVSVDIDGHEAAFLRGAKVTLGRDLPPISMEFAQECLHFAGSDVRELACILRDLGYQICSERTRSPYPDELAFLKECGNFSHYANALAIPKDKY